MVDVPGRPPKPADKRARTNRDFAPQIELHFEPCGVPELPSYREDDEGNTITIHWSRLTLDWWEDWINSPQAALFSKSDWRSLITTAFIHERFVRTQSLSAAAELRSREAAFGATPIDRLRLRMSLLDVEGAETKATERRRRQSAQGVKPPTAGRYAGLAAVPD